MRGGGVWAQWYKACCIHCRAEGTRAGAGSVHRHGGRARFSDPRRAKRPHALCAILICTHSWRSPGPAVPRRQSPTTPFPLPPPLPAAPTASPVLTCTLCGASTPTSSSWYSLPVFIIWIRSPRDTLPSMTCGGAGDEAVGQQTVSATRRCSYEAVEKNPSQPVTGAGESVAVSCVEGAQWDGIRHDALVEVQPQTRTGPSPIKPLRFR